MIAEWFVVWIGLQRNGRGWCCVRQDGSGAGALASECALELIRRRTGAEQQSSVQPARSHRVPHVGPTHTRLLAHRHSHPEGVYIRLFISSCKIVIYE